MPSFISISLARLHDAPASWTGAVGGLVPQPPWPGQRTGDGAAFFQLAIDSKNSRLDLVPRIFESKNSMASMVDSGWRSCRRTDRKSTRLNSSHVKSAYAVFCLKKEVGDDAARERMSQSARET